MRTITPMARLFNYPANPRKPFSPIIFRDGFIFDSNNFEVVPYSGLPAGRLQDLDQLEALA